MKLTRIIAIRHGETNWNVVSRIQGHLDIELNDHGRWQAQQLTHALRHEVIDAVYCSDLSRARETAQAFCSSLGLTPQEVRALRERHFGDFEGLTWTELEAQFPSDSQAWKSRDPDWLPPNGESLSQLRERIQTCLSELASAHADQQIVVVTHGGVLDVLYRIATHQFDASPRTWTLGNTAINRLLWSSEGLHLVGWGDQRHLEVDPS
jgi:2,3-bisphosphoglycerate-dependent phosphoglycerate mutase